MKSSFKQRHAIVQFSDDRSNCAIDLDRFYAKYDAVGGGANNRRRASRIETTAETGADSQELRPADRLRLINLARDLDRNFSQSRTFLNQLAMNVVGSHFRLSIKQDTDSARSAEKWFNKYFSRNCDFRGTRHLADFNRALFRAVILDGDCGLAFDDRLEDSGRLIVYPSDQICDPSPLPDGVEATNDGVLLDKYGREIGYFTTNEIGRTSAPLKSGFSWARDPTSDDNNNFTLLRLDNKFNQYRGITSFAPSVADLLDSYEMRSKVLQSAKVTSSFAGVVKRKDSGVDDKDVMSDPRLNPDNLHEELLKELQQGQASGEGEGDGDGKPADDLPNYDNLEALTGGNMEYMADGDEFQILDPGSRPQLNSEEFIKRVVRSAASALGLPPCYATLEVQTSYTAFRGELVLAWRTISTLQKWFEREVQDWEARHALRWAMSRGLIPPLGDGWEESLVWVHPRMPSVDPQKEQAALTAALKNGTTSLQLEYGPAWREILADQEEELQAFHDCGRLYPAEVDNNGMAASDPAADDEN